MNPKLIEISGHYYLQTLPDIWDLAAALVSFANTLAVMLMVWRAVALLLRRPRQRRWRAFCTLIILCGGGYSVLYMLDIPGVLAVITTQGGDVPPLSTIKTGLISILLFTLSGVLNGATRAEVDHDAT